MVRRLQHTHSLVPEEPAHGDLQEGTGGDVIAVEDCDEFAGGRGQSLVDVAGLGMAVVVANNVAATGGGGKQAEFLTPSVVQDVNLEFIAGPVHVQRGQHGGRTT